jgi:hypothetical protein
MHETPDLLLIGDGRLARHLARYFAQLGMGHAAWSRRMHEEGRCPDLATLVGSQTHALLAISDGAIETFVSAHPELEPTLRIHFSGGLATPLAIGAHPLFSFALCVLAGNFTTLLWRKLFFELDREYGIPREQALPYLESVARGLAETGAPLSGPLSRGDTATIARNLEALKGDPFEAVYRAFVEAYERQQELAVADTGKNWLAPH